MISILTIYSLESRPDVLLAHYAQAETFDEANGVPKDANIVFIAGMCGASFPTIREFALSERRRWPFKLKIIWDNTGLEW